MNKEFAARCGLRCDQCSYREKQNCPGCIKAEGKMFWGECVLARCCMEKELEHCGKCRDFPCADLRKFAYDKDQGDNGERIRNLEQWNETGF